MLVEPPSSQYQPSLVRAVRSLVDVPSPVVTAPFPNCGGTCDEIARCYISCAQEKGYQINTCFCSLLSWPTACGVQCSQPDDRSSIAAWYWDVCPSKMDSQLGQMGITRWQSPLKTLDDWAIPTPEATTTLTGYDCYYSSLCSGAAVETISVVPGSSNTEVDTVVSAVKGLLVKILVPVFLIAFGIAIFILYRHPLRFSTLKLRNRRHRVEEQAPGPNRQDNDQIVNLVRFINDLLDRQQPAQQNNAVINEIQRANNSIAEVRATAVNILLALNQRPVRENQGQDPVPGAELWAALKEQLSCAICFEIFHHPVAVINDAAYQGVGCLHTFCGGCAVILVRDGPRPVKCPEDRGIIRTFNEHRLLSQICQEYLDRFPAEKRGDDDLAAMDLLYVPGQRIL